MFRSLRSRLALGLGVLSLALLVAYSGVGQPTTPEAVLKARQKAGQTIPDPLPLTEMPKPKSPQFTYKVYSLTKLGFSTEMGEWVADSLPKHVEPTAWEAGKLSYDRSSNVLVVSQSAKMHARISQFLDQIRAAQVTTPVRVPEYAKVSPPYVSRQRVLWPIRQAVAQVSSPPSQPKPAKHRFEFSVRYEGDGLIDSSVVDLVKAYAAAENGGDATTSYRWFPDQNRWCGSGCSAPDPHLCNSPPVGLPVVVPAIPRRMPRASVDGR